MKKIIVLFVMLGAALFTYAQNEIDALRYTFTQYYGTGRSIAMGNAFGALGADMGAIAINPAAVATFKHNTFTITPFFAFDKAVSTFNGTTKQNFDYKFALDNFGLLFTTPGKLSFAITVNKIANYNHDILIEGVNDKGSFMDALMLDADGLWPDELNPYTTGPAFDTYVIDTIPGTLTYTNALWWSLAPGEEPTYGETQKKVAKTQGAGNKTDLAVGYNFGDKLFLGASVNFFSFNYSETSEYSEDFSNLNVDIDYMEYTQQLTQTVSGLGFSVGMIYSPIKNIRIGGSFVSPSSLHVKERYNVKMYSHFVTPDAYGNTSYEASYPYDNNDAVNYYDYHIYSPMHMTASLGFITRFGSFGIEYEYVTYNLMKMSADDNTFEYANETIQGFKNGENLRAGGELRLGIVRVRAGGSYYPSPTSYLSDVLVLSGGIGVISGNTSLDFSFSQSSQGYPNYYLYNGYSDEPVPSVQINNYSMNVTLGIKLD